MKKTLLVAAMALMGTAASAQSGTGWGIKAGLSYNKNGDLVRKVSNSTQNVIERAEEKTGYHFGLWGKLDFPKMYIRPELVYSKTKSSYNIENNSSDYDLSKLDLPVLIGVKIVGPLHIFAGPAFQYVLDNDLGGLQVQDVENDFSVGLNAGVGVNLGKLGLDVRYERGFSKNEGRFIGNNATNIEGRVDSRPSQVIFALSLKL